jgi:hypothetical protein
MGPKTWMLVLADTNAREALAARSTLDRGASLTLARLLFPGERLEIMGEVDLSYACPPDDEIHIGCFPGVSVVAAKEFGIDYPSKLDRRFIAAGGRGTVTLHAMHSVVDWFAYAVWVNGKLARSLSLAPDYGIMEDLGQRLPFEEPFWSGEHSEMEDEEEEFPYPFPFDPLELGEAALVELFGYQLEGSMDAPLLDPMSVPLLCCKRSRRAWWKFW